MKALKSGKRLKVGLFSSLFLPVLLPLDSVKLPPQLLCCFPPVFFASCRPWPCSHCWQRCWRWQCWCWPGCCCYSRTWSLMTLTVVIKFHFLRCCYYYCCCCCCWCCWPCWWQHWQQQVRSWENQKPTFHSTLQHNHWRQVWTWRLQGLASWQTFSVSE